MRKLLVAFLMLLSLNAQAGPRVEVGIAKETANVEWSSATIVGSGKAERTAAIVGVGYLHDLNSFAVEGNASLSTATIKDAKDSPIRIEANLVKPLGDRFRVKAGPSFSYNLGDSGPLNKSSIGYQVSGEMDFNADYFASAGLWNTRYTGSSSGIDLKTSVDSVQVRIGFNF